MIRVEILKKKAQQGAEQGVYKGPLQVSSEIVGGSGIHLFPDHRFKVEYLDHPDTEKPLPDLFGEGGKSLLGRSVKEMYLFAQNFCGHHQKGHGDQGQGGERRVGPDHDGDTGSPQKNGIHHDHQSESEGHPYMVDIRGGVGHDIPGSGPVVISHIQGKYVGVKFVTDTPFQVPGRSHEKDTPAVTEQGHKQPQSHDEQALVGQCLPVGCCGGKGINGLFDDLWNDELGHIHNDHADNTQ